MNPATGNTTDTDTFVSPLARIDAQEEFFVSPIREYLEANGCRVLLDGLPTEQVTYHIVAGDFDFVKKIFSSRNSADGKTLGIVVSSSVSDAKTLVSPDHKIVVVDPLALNREDVIEVFSFFFAGGSSVFDKRRNRHVPTTKNSEPRTQNTESEEKNKEDEKRIGSIITEVFERPRSQKQKKQWKRFWTRAILTIAIMVVPLMWYTGSLAATGASFLLSAKYLQSGSTTRAIRWEQVGGYWLRQSEVSFRVLRIPLQLVGRTETVRGQERLLSFLRDSEAAFGKTHEVIAQGRDVASVVLGGNTQSTGGTPAAALEKLRLAASSLNNSLGLAQTQLTTLVSDRTFPFFVAPLGQAGNEASASLIAIRKMVSSGESLLALYPRMAGFTEPQIYLVLLQNSTELRPTGGFIGSIGKLTLDGGIMRDLTIQDVYAVDGQLKGHVDPPLPIRELMGQEHWYLRDSNWDPDFSVSGARAAWFYEKETGESVDGVIALSLPLVVDILRVTGPVVLPDYNEQITADNFFGKSMYYTKNNFFPGSTAKADFLGTLTRTLLLKLSTDTHVNPSELFEVFVTGIARRDIQFLFTDPELQTLVTHFGWAGQFSGNGCQGAGEGTCLFDPFVVNEANLSVSKVNAFIKHDNHREIVVATDGSVTETTTLTITNTATGNELGIGGVYRTYIRLFLPTDVSIRDITLDGVSLRQRTTTEAGTPTLPYTEWVDAPERMQGLATALEVAPGTNRRLRVSYTRGINMGFADSSSSSLDVLQYKQAGVSDVVQTLTIHYPVFWKATSGSEVLPAVAKDGELEYNTILSRDLRVRVLFTK